jgi:S-adenosylmethionine-diacylglycerol 3-amino-3-carboxypropyl transferase
MKSTNKEKLTEQVDFSFIRYANCWEDAELLLEGLNPQPNSNVLSIASAGDNSFAFLATNNVKVYGVDVNEVQINLCELKKAAITILTREEFLQCMGFVASNNRLVLYNKCKHLMPEPIADWWSSRTHLIEQGIIHEGKFEKYFKKFRTYILPLIHSKKTIAALFEEKTEEQQASFFANKFNSWRWKLLFRIFFSKWVMGKLGRDPKFLEQVDINVSDFIFEQSSKHLASKACQKNVLLHYIFTGMFNDHYLPYYVRKGVYEQIQKNINNITFTKGYAQSITCPGGFSYANLSNIFEYMDTYIFREVLVALLPNLNTNASIAYWNLMVKRQLYLIMPKHFEKAVSNYNKVDDGFFYRSFNINTKK